MPAAGTSEKCCASWLPFGAAVLVPMILLVAMGLFSFAQARHDAELRAQRAAQALAEHALRTFRAHDLIINAVDKYLMDWTWADISSSRQLHEFFKGLIRNADDINTIFVVGPTGREGNSSLIFPLAPTDMRGRPFYEELRKQGELHISDPDIGRINKQRYFSFTRRLTSPDAAFNGVVSVSVNPGYFENFYKSMVETPTDSVALVRADGLVLARVPELPRAGSPVLPHFRGGLREAIAADPVAGTFTEDGSGDDVTRLYAYRRIGEYPLYASYGLSYAAIWATWRHTMLAFALVCLLAAVVLLAAATAVRRHNRRETEVAGQFSREIARRMAAEETSRSKDEFLATLGHELRNPLSSISAGVEILRREETPLPVRAEAVNIIGRQIDHLQRLLCDLLDVARTVYGKMNLDVHKVSLLDVAAGVAAQYAGALRGEVAISVGGSHALVNADVTRLRQIIENLVDNAHKYGAHTINLNVAELGESVELTVTDDGEGIPAALLPTLFEPFVQGDQTLDRAKGGLGLGLALVRRLTVAHGGTLHAHSAGPGQGSTFTIRLPKAAPQDAPNPRSEDAAPAGTPARVLVIEDQQDARETLRMLLELDHHNVETASNGPDGVAKFEFHSPDVVLVDIGLPEMNGYDVARAIRARPDGTHPYLIALTGYGQPEDIRRAHEAGFDRHLTKPVIYTNLKEILVRSTKRHTG